MLLYKQRGMPIFLDWTSKSIARLTTKSRKRHIFPPRSGQERVCTLLEIRKGREMLWHLRGTMSFMTVIPPGQEHFNKFFFHSTRQEHHSQNAYSRACNLRKHRIVSFWSVASKMQSINSLHLAMSLLWETVLREVILLRCYYGSRLLEFDFKDKRLGSQLV